MRISDWSSDVCSSDLPEIDHLAEVMRPIGDRVIEHRPQFGIVAHAPVEIVNDIFQPGVVELVEDVAAHAHESSPIMYSCCMYPCELIYAIYIHIKMRQIDQGARRDRSA